MNVICHGLGYILAAKKSKAKKDKRTPKPVEFGPDLEES